MSLLQLAWKNLTFKPLNMFMNVLLFALGVGLISLLFTVQKQVEDNFSKNLAGIDLVIGAKGSPLQLILSSMYHIDAPTGNITLQEIRPFLNPKHPLIASAIPLSLGDSHNGFRVVGTTPDIFSCYEAELAQGRTWEVNMEVVLGANVAQQLQLRIGDTFSSTHGFLEDDNLAHEHADFKVVGILTRNGSVLDQLILTNNQSYWEVHEHKEESSTEVSEEEDHKDHDHDHEGHDHGDHEDHDHNDHDHAGHDHHQHAAPPVDLLAAPGDKSITSLLVKFKGRNFKALQMPRSINENTNMQAATPAIEINRLYDMMNTGQDALRVLAFVIILVSALSIFISLYTSLRERRYELALMRSQGATPGKIFSLIMLEGLLLAVLGYTFGILLSHGSMTILGDALEEQYRYSFSAWTFLREEGYLLVGSLVIGIVAALLPAVQASKTDIADTLMGG